MPPRQPRQTAFQNVFAARQAGWILPPPRHRQKCRHQRYQKCVSIVFQFTHALKVGRETFKHAVRMPRPMNSHW